MAAARLPDRSAGELARVGRELYGLPPGEFTAARTAAVRQARSAGDKELARAVGALRRPALAAWAVNLLVREQAGLLEQVTAMGDSLRDAQAQLDGEALRDLTRQRRRLVTAVTAQVAAVAAEHGHPLSAAASRQVEETVQAALVDPRAATAVRSGVLVAPLTSTGVESLAEVLGIPLPDTDPDSDHESDPAPGSGPGPDTAPGRPALALVPEDEEAARQEAEDRAAERAAAARKAARRAEKSAGAAAKGRDKAESARAKAQARLLQLEAEAEELRRRLAEVEARAEEAATKLSDREAAVEEAATAAEAAAREAEDARVAAEEAAATAAAGVTD